MNTFFFNRLLAILKTSLPKHIDRFKAIVRKSILARDLEICESKLFKHNRGFYLHLVVQKEVDVPELELTDKTVVIALSQQRQGSFLLLKRHHRHLHMDKLLPKGSNLQPFWTALYDNGMLHYDGDLFNFTCVDAKTGKLIWTTHLTGNTGPHQPTPTARSTLAASP